MSNRCPTPAGTLSELLTVSAARYGTRDAIIVGEERIDFVGLDLRAGRCATVLQERGLQTGDRVTLWMPNGIDWVIAYFGALRAGLVVNPVNFLLTEEEVAHASLDCGARALIGDPARREELLRIARHASITTVCASGAGSVAGILDLTSECARASCLAPVHVEPDALAAVLYTSGTTGKPKGAMLSHRGLLLNAALMAQMHARSNRDLVVTALPLPHVYGSAVLNAGLLAGATLNVHARFNEADILRGIERHRATLFEGVPTMFHYLMASPALEQADVSSLTRCTVGGQSMPPAKMQEVERRLGCPLIELWGMTELGGLGATHASWSTPALGSIGVALPHMEARIADAQRAEVTLPRGEIGELCMRGPLVMQGYFNNERATAEAIDVDGWLHTGDLATQDDQGYLRIVDRKKDMILTAGYNVYPAEIERVIAQMPAVAMVAVGARPDEAKGEIAKAYIVLRTQHTLTEDQVIAHCREHLAAYKLPRQVQFVPDLPKTSTGKVLRRSLRTLDQTATQPGEAT